jgi:AraC-like DNA-binding protein
MSFLPSPVLPPRTEGVMTRLVVARLQDAGLDSCAVLRKAGLTVDEVNDPKTRLDVRCQVVLLRLAAEVLGDPLLGFHLAKTAELRQLGRLYFVFASSATFRDGLARAKRYSTLVNEGIVLRCLPSREIGVAFDFVGVPRHTDRHQIEVCATVLVRIARETTRTALRPVRVTFVHPRCAASGSLDAFFGCRIDFGSKRDAVFFRTDTADLPLVRADPYLHDLLIAYCEEALSDRARRLDMLRTRVENAATPLLPHGKVRVSEVARSLGLSQRTLARRLAADGLTFAAIMDELRANLARHYLKDLRLSISEIAWLLGFQEVSAFTHAYKRWTGIPPSRARSLADSSDQ